jgi:hypothetical protein
VAESLKVGSIQGMKEPAYRKPPLDDSGSSALPPIEVLRDEVLVVTRRDCVDHGTRDEHGAYDYFYAFAAYEIQSGGIAYRARRYSDTWADVALYSPEGQSWAAVPYDDDMFTRVARYFFALEDVRRVNVLIHGYEEVDPTRLGGD